MATESIVVKFSSFTAQKGRFGQQSKNKVNCSAIAIGPGLSGRNANEKKSYQLVNTFKTLKPLVDQLFEAKNITLTSGSSCFVRFTKDCPDSEHLLLVSLGEDKTGVNKLGPVERLRRIGALIAQKAQSEKVSELNLYVDSFLMPSAQTSIDAEDAAYALAEGIGLSLYEFKKYKTAKKESSTPMQFNFISDSQSRVTSFKKGIEKAEATIWGTTLCRDLGNEPSNILTPEEFAKRAKTVATQLGLKCTILDEKQIQKEKMGLLYGVAKGSKKPPRVVLLEYSPKKANKNTKTVAFVGKGVTFDSGGISIKPSARMEDMKHDMCGAAAVLGAIAACAKLKLNTKIVMAIGVVENMPGGNALQPGNIVTARSGKTVEISNTDAEGRLVLADVLDYVQDMKVDHIIDLATLTGAVVITLGKSCAGLMANDSSFGALTHKAATESGERVWELPLYEEYFDDLKSEYADMRNSGDVPSHGTAKGAMFMLQFIRPETKWVHLDIAAMAYANGLAPYYPKKSSTGYGVRLLVELADLMQK